MEGRVTEVTDDERGWRNEAGSWFQRLDDTYRNERSVILRDDDEDDDECDDEYWVWKFTE